MEKTDEFLVSKLINELYKQREWLAFKDIDDDKSIKERLQDLHAIIMSTKFVKEEQIGHPYIYRYLIQPYGILQLKKHLTFEKYLYFITQEANRKEQLEKYELLSKKFIYKARYFPYILSLFAIVISILSYFKKQEINSKGIQKEQESIQQAPKVGTLQKNQLLPKIDSNKLP